MKIEGLITMNYRILCLSIALFPQLGQCYSEEYKQPYKSAINSNAKQSSIETSSSNILLFTGVYGFSSGILCRIFERKILNDLFILRLCNMYLWGAIERSILNDYSEDLEKQNIPHSPHGIQNLARIMSWLGYFLA